MLPSYIPGFKKNLTFIQLSSEARKLLVDSYVALRRGDTTPGSRVAYRMTVRQLEALIRLSEAIARSHLETQVFILESHPSTSFRLLGNLNLSNFHLCRCNLAMFVLQ